MCFDPRCLSGPAYCFLFFYHFIPTTSFFLFQLSFSSAVYSSCCILDHHLICFKPVRLPLYSPTPLPFNFLFFSFSCEYPTAPLAYFAHFNFTSAVVVVTMSQWTLVSKLSLPMFDVIRSIWSIPQRKATNTTFCFAISYSSCVCANNTYQTLELMLAAKHCR